VAIGKKENKSSAPKSNKQMSVEKSRQRLEARRANMFAQVHEQGDCSLWAVFFNHRRGQKFWETFHCKS
jgi:G:T/U-mismatch repair DNA glycosylase